MHNVPAALLIKSYQTTESIGCKLMNNITQMENTAGGHRVIIFLI